ncbi:class I SAM-dependent methyltransferase [Pseudolysinimonas sp.]|uniref:class I SAM-dependent methyltransferase n=1 Tax=Pseudolysinimonas sp. TaxID=2680009 RepID=UPI003F7D4640
MSQLIASFGAGGGEPYARALEAQGGTLYLHALDGSVAAMDVARWSADADATDLRLLRMMRGPVLDIGCGPGRMVKASLELGRQALGIDVSPTVVRRARAAGLPVLELSVFDELPDEGAWRTVLLIDGNIGIGGDPAALLRRCRELLHPRGEIVVETHPSAGRERAFQGSVTGDDGRRSGVFPWAEIGAVPLARVAREKGLRTVQSWSADGRTFCRLRISR